MVTPLFISIEWLLSNPEVGWVVVVLYLMWEIRGPKGKIHDLANRVEGIVVVVRAIAQVHNDIDTGQVDKYLTRNGKEPSDFIRDNGTAYDLETDGSGLDDPEEQDDEEDEDGIGFGEEPGEEPSAHSSRDRV